ncbi:MAG: copper resistance protein CopC, partial [Chloroflexi bacterium]|nr:copper resistance protein CopC [Chloroflexota bacterium]
MNSATTLRKTFLWAVLGVIALAVLLLAARPAFAHAALARAVPAPNAVLDASPERVQLWFTEPVAPAFSEIQVLNATGERVDKGGATVDGGDPTMMSVAVEPLGQGTYTVAWKNVSTVDGHGLVDSFVFSVGQPITQPSGAQKAQPLLS